jgi:hypothetical protein
MPTPITLATSPVSSARHGLRSEDRRGSTRPPAGRTIRAGRRANIVSLGGWLSAHSLRPPRASTVPCSAARPCQVPPFAAKNPRPTSHRWSVRREPPARLQPRHPPAAASRKCPMPLGASHTLVWPAVTDRPHRPCPSPRPPREHRGAGKSFRASPGPARQPHFRPASSRPTRPDRFPAPGPPSGRPSPPPASPGRLPPTRPAPPLHAADRFASAAPFRKNTSRSHRPRPDNPGPAVDRFAHAI